MFTWGLKEQVKAEGVANSHALLFRSAWGAVTNIQLQITRRELPQVMCGDTQNLRSRVHFLGMLPGRILPPWEAHDPSLESWPTEYVRFTLRTGDIQRQEQ